VGVGSRLDDGWRLHGGGSYDLWLLGPDGLHRQFRGDARDAGMLEAQLVPAAAGVLVRLINRGEEPQPVKLESRMDDGWCAMAHVQADGTLDLAYGGCQGWYDVEISAPAMPAFGRRLAGRIDASKPGLPDPRLEAGAALPLD